MTTKKTVKELGDLRDEAKRLPRKTRLMMIDPNDHGHFVQVGHVEVRYIDPENVIEDKEDYFDNEVLEETDETDKDDVPVLVFYAAHD